MTALAPRFAPIVAVANAPAPILFDLSRLVSRALHPTPTGIDRVDMAYARALLAQPARHVAFTARLPGLGQCRLAPAAVTRFIAATMARWDDDNSGQGRLLSGNPALALLAGIGRGGAVVTGAIRLMVAHQLLDRPELLRRQLARSQTRLVAFIHDAIPAEYPEYARPGGADRHRIRLATAARLANGLIVNSQATADAMTPWLAPGAAAPPLLIAPLGVNPHPKTPDLPSPIRPYFLCLATLEPRKNHLLLLNIWRRMAETLPPESIPRLILVGRRGWENENVVDLLDRCPALDGIVEERGRIPDAALATLMAGARAVLLPSFAEGYGLPVAEALGQGVPVIASNLAALRETGGAVPEYLDPLDGPAWLAAITDYARPGSKRRQQQLRRLNAWEPPRWETHFTNVFTFLDSLKP
nr:glycosyltransferase family 1 protein [Polymorphobacter sp.]